MTTVLAFLGRQSARLVALVLILILYKLAELPTLSHTEHAALATHFNFTKLSLPDIANAPHKSVRAVQPSLERISAWISSVGAAVALADLDGDGLPNDICTVDPRTDLVTVLPAPGTGERYQALVLNPAPLPYDPTTMAPMGCVPGDVNEDGHTDLLVYYWGRTPILFLSQTTERGQGLSYTPRELTTGGERWFTNAATLADLDGDGHVDIIIANYFQDGAHILDTQATGVEVLHSTKSKSFNGGRKHVFLWAGATSGTEPTVRFTEAKDIFDEEVDRGWTLAVGAADLDGDLLSEIYFANDFGPDRLLHNRSMPGHLHFAVLEGTGGFTIPKSFVLGHDSFKGMGVDFADLNDDGVLDIYVSNITSEFALQESHLLWLSTGDVKSMRNARAPYRQASEELGLSRSGWGWDARLADFDNDGVLEAIQATGFVKGEVNRWPELQALGTGNDQLMHDPRFWPRFRPGDDLSGHEANAFFVRANDGHYYNLAEELKLNDSTVTRGIAIADIDGDGDLDFVLANQWEPFTLYRNDCPHCGRFLGLHLLLPLEPGQPASVMERVGHPDAKTPGRVAIGATATVFLPDGRQIVAQVDGGSGHSGKRSADLHFGLGNPADGKTLPVVLRWRDPNGRTHQETRLLSAGWHTVQLAWPK